MDSHLCGAGAAAGVGRSRVDTPTLLLGAWAWAVAAAYRVAVGLARCRSCRTSMASCCGCAWLWVGGVGVGGVGGVVGWGGGWRRRESVAATRAKRGIPLGPHTRALWGQTTPWWGHTPWVHRLACVRVDDCGGGPWLRGWRGSPRPSHSPIPPNVGRRTALTSSTPPHPTTGAHHQGHHQHKQEFVCDKVRAAVDAVGWYVLFVCPGRAGPPPWTGGRTRTRWGLLLPLPLLGLARARRGGGDAGRESHAAPPVVRGLDGLGVGQRWATCPTRCSFHHLNPLHDPPTRSPQPLRHHPTGHPRPPHHTTKQQQQQQPCLRTRERAAKIVGEGRTRTRRPSVTCSSRRTAKVRVLRGWRGGWEWRSPGCYTCAHAHSFSYPILSIL